MRTLAGLRPPTVVPPPFSYSLWREGLTPHQGIKARPAPWTPRQEGLLTPFWLLTLGYSSFLYKTTPPRVLKTGSVCVKNGSWRDQGKTLLASVYSKRYAGPWVAGKGWQSERSKLELHETLWALFASHPASQNTHISTPSPSAATCKILNLMTRPVKGAP